MTSRYIYAACHVLVDDSVCHEQISVFINAYTLLALSFLSTLLGLTLTPTDLSRDTSNSIYGGLLSQFLVVKINDEVKRLEA